jgi:hypothetical protein
MDELGKRAGSSRSTVHRLENVKMTSNGVHAVSAEKLASVLVLLPGIDDDLTTTLGAAWTASRAHEQLLFRGHIAAPPARWQESDECVAAHTILFATPGGSSRYRMSLTPIDHDDVDEMVVLSEQTRHVFRSFGLTSWGTM